MRTNIDSLEITSRSLRTNKHTSAFTLINQTDTVTWSIRCNDDTKSLIKHQTNEYATTLLCQTCVEPSIKHQTNEYETGLLYLSCAEPINQI